jgi:hypothetical protein
MRAHKRAQAIQLSVRPAEVLEVRTLLSATALSSLAATANVAALHSSIVSHLAATPNVNASTVPGNGDVNPYGVAFVPKGVASGGKLHAGDVLVSNFNNSNNSQGTESRSWQSRPTDISRSSSKAKGWD